MLSGLVDICQRFDKLLNGRKNLAISETAMLVEGPGFNVRRVFCQECTSSPETILGGLSLNQLEVPLDLSQQYGL